MSKTGKVNSILQGIMRGCVHMIKKENDREEGSDETVMTTLTDGKIQFNL